MNDKIRATHEGIRTVLKTVGPLTSIEIAQFFPGSSTRCVSGMLSTMRIKAAIKQIYIQSWVRESEHGKDSPRPVYALGCSKDAPKPRRMNNSEKCKRYRARMIDPSKIANSVFTWRPHG